MITPGDKAILDDIVSRGDARKKSPAFISNALKRAGEKFNDRPATPDELNQYIHQKNDIRPIDRHLPTIDETD
ncbi:MULTISPECIES: hypothetical protein [Methylorubrum]|uniref:hypothetical protein n=1 Tax=Methylorubrum TaxID=2282523 RepID=UPI0020A06E59|nr:MULTISPECIES: hypothetical protein [Methylorubrum]MCP1551695.1 hypothetical protein [Methylorubrum zatmanii]MCP1556624.1 hypothetical protein [Methylorubrum extorquens]MCP1581743.1 hypothetical protein [Methylorubrum extorquens]